MKIFKIVLTLATLIATAMQGNTADDKGLDIAQEADTRDNGWFNNSVVVTMKLKNKQGQETTRQLRNYSLEVKGDGDKSIVVFESPADVQGTAFLTHSHKTGDDDQWMFMPSLERVKRISSSNKSGPFMGSEFAYEDIASQEVEKYTYKFLSEDRANGEECYAVERYPLDKNSGYTRQKVWFNRNNYRIEKIEFFDRKNVLLKTLTYSNYQQYLDRYWRAGQMHMVNHINGKETLIEFSNYKFKTEMTEDDFTQNALKRIK